MNPRRLMILVMLAITIASAGCESKDKSGVAIIPSEQQPAEQKKDDAPPTPSQTPAVKEVPVENRPPAMAENKEASAEIMNRLRTVEQNVEKVLNQVRQLAAATPPQIPTPNVTVTAPPSVFEPFEERIKALTTHVQQLAQHKPPAMPDVTVQTPASAFEPITKQITQLQQQAKEMTDRLTTLAEQDPVIPKVTVMAPAEVYKPIVDRLDRIARNEWPDISAHLERIRILEKNLEAALERLQALSKERTKTAPDVASVTPPPADRGAMAMKLPEPAAIYRWIKTYEGEPALLRIRGTELAIFLNKRWTPAREEGEKLFIATSDNVFIPIAPARTAVNPEHLQ